MTSSSPGRAQGTALRARCPLSRAGKDIILTTTRPMSGWTQSFPRTWVTPRCASASIPRRSRRLLRRRRMRCEKTLPTTSRQRAINAAPEVDRPGALQRIRSRLANHTHVSWNQFVGWLRQVEGLREVVKSPSVTHSASGRLNDIHPCPDPETLPQHRQTRSPAAGSLANESANRR
jgi:hypothetical protein